MGIYIVPPGDCLSVIAQNHGISLRELLDLNPWIEDPDYIQVGWEITLP